MANKKISDLPAGSALGTTQIPVMNSGVTQQITLSQITVNKLVNSGKEVTLDAAGVLTLPTGGDIVDSDGNSVLNLGLTGFSTGNLVVGNGPGPLDGNRIYTSNVGGTITLVPDGGAVEIGIVGETGIFLRFQDGTEQSTAYTTTNKIDAVLWVSATGNNTGATGSANKPFATIQAAHDYAATTYAVGADVVILVAPGSHAGVTLTRPRTHVLGFAGLSNATRITGTVTVNPTTVVGGVYNSVFTLENFLLAPNSGHALVITGNQQLNFIGHKLKFYTDNNGQSCLVANNTASGGIRLFLHDSDIQNNLTNSITVDITNVFSGALKRCNIYGGTNFAFKATSSTMTLDNTNASATFTDVLSITNSSVITAGNSTFTNSQANSNGINIASGATAVIGQCAFDVPTGTGYAVKGVAGSVFVYANNIIAYGKNNKISNTMTSLSMGTSFTPSA